MPGIEEDGRGLGVSKPETSSESAVLLGLPSFHGILARGQSPVMRQGGWCVLSRRLANALGRGTFWAEVRRLLPSQSPCHVLAAISGQEGSLALCAREHCASLQGVARVDDLLFHESVRRHPLCSGLGRGSFVRSSCHEPGRSALLGRSLLDTSAPGKEAETRSAGGVHGPCGGYDLKEGCS